MDFLYLNIVGYLCYTTSICLLYFNPLVREQYADKYTPKTPLPLPLPPDTASSSPVPTPHQRNYPLIQINDVAYTVHGLICALVVYAQVHFAGFKRHKSQRVSKYTQLILAAVGAICIAIVGSVLYIPHATDLTLLDVAEVLAYVKVAMSTAKHIPQLLYNHQRRSTKGWAIQTTVLDVSGAGLSICQLILDAYRSNDMGNILGNTSKLSLASVTMMFGAIFLIQHYVLYPSTRPPEVICLDGGLNKQLHTS